MITVELHIPGFAIAYYSHIKVNGKSEGEWRLGPKSVQASDLPEELQNQIAEWLKTYEANRRNLIDQNINLKFVMGESRYEPVNAR